MSFHKYFKVCVLPASTHSYGNTFILQKHKRFSPKVRKKGKGPSSYIKALYKNFPNSEDIKAIKESYKKQKEKTVSTKVIMTILSLIFTLNKFIFICTHYLQIMDCAMGTTCVPSYANIFIGTFEAKHIHPYIKEVFPLYL